MRSVIALYSLREKFAFGRANSIHKESTVTEKGDKNEYKSSPRSVRFYMMKDKSGFSAWTSNRILCVERAVQYIWVSYSYQVGKGSEKTGMYSAFHMTCARYRSSLSPNAPIEKRNSASA